MLPKKAMCLLLAILTIVTAQDDETSSRFRNSKDRFLWQNRRSIDSTAPATPRHDPRFDPDVLNRFLEEYASKMKRTTERPSAGYEEAKLEHEGQDFESLVVGTSLKNNTDTDGSGDTLVRSILSYSSFGQCLEARSLKMQ
jgi:hypothetical protein